MKEKIIIYHCYGGAHSSVTAAGIYLGRLPRNHPASAGELLKTPHFDNPEAIIHGHFRYVGRTPNGTAVYVLGKKNLPRVSLLLQRTAGLAGCGQMVYPVDTTAPINPLMVLGGFLSRRLRLVGIGRPLVIWGTRLAYPRLVELVTQVEAGFHLGFSETLKMALSRRIILYVCPNTCRLPLLVAGLHWKPNWEASDLLEWVDGQGFDGEIGSISRLGSTEGYELYLVGAGNEPRIVTRMLREYRSLLGIPQSQWTVVEVPLIVKPLETLLLKASRLLGCRKGLTGQERRLLHQRIPFCRELARRIRLGLKEGIP